MLNTERQMQTSDQEIKNGKPLFEGSTFEFP